MTNGAKSEATEPKFEALLEYLRASRGFDFTAYKRASLMRRVQKRMNDVGMADYEAYRDYLEVHPDEFVQLFNCILINVTSFFRDEHAWDFLSKEVVPRVLSGKSPTDILRVWSAGCASGEEAYSLAMIFAEAMGEDAFSHRVKIYASDVDLDALTHARMASYSAESLEAVPVALRSKYFVQAGDRFVFRADLRRAIIFGRHDLVQDAPISRLDLLACRNTLMYFNADTQSKILARFHFALNDSGFLFMGRAEMLLTHGHLFTPLDLRHRLFAKVPRVNARDRMLLMVQGGNPEAVTQLGHHIRLREGAFDRSPVAQLVVDAQGLVALANERMRIIFGLGNQDVGRPIQDLEISYRPTDLRSLIDQARAERRGVTLAGVERRTAGGETQYYNVEANVVVENGDTPIGVMISFFDVSRFHQLQGEFQRSNQELETANEELQSAQEELETTNEELQSTNEELETTNEELQSTNEELETMNEELQSTNEELETTNTELRQRTVELDNANLFLGSILRSLNSGVVVLDRKKNVLIWNHRAEDLWGLRPDEVQNRPFFRLDIGLPVRDLTAPVERVLNGKSQQEEVQVPAVNRRGKPVNCTVICTPLGPDSQPISGAVLLMIEADSQPAPARGKSDGAAKRGG